MRGNYFIEKLTISTLRWLVEFLSFKFVRPAMRKKKSIMLTHACLSSVNSKSHKKSKRRYGSWAKFDHFIKNGKKIKQLNGVYYLYVIFYEKQLHYTFFYKNQVKWLQPHRSYFSADLSLKVFLFCYLNLEFSLKLFLACSYFLLNLSLTVLIKLFL